MSQFTAKTAAKSSLKLRIALTAPSGAGKTFGALLLASGIVPWDKIAVIDTENETSNFYSDLGPYAVIPFLPPYTPERFIEAIAAAESQGFEVIILDSASAEWEGAGGILDLKENSAAWGFAPIAGDSFTKWSKLTPRHDSFVTKVRHSKCHIIATLRAKQDHAMEQVNGRTVIRKLGMGAVQRDNIEYEFDLCLSIDRDTHTATASKDRTRLFEGKPEFMLSAETGKELLTWANTADPKAIAHAEQAEKAEMEALAFKGFIGEISRMMRDTTILWPQTFKDDVNARMPAAKKDLALLKALHTEIATQHSALKTN